MGKSIVHKFKFAILLLIIPFFCFSQTMLEPNGLPYPFVGEVSVTITSIYIEEFEYFGFSQGYSIEYFEDFFIRAITINGAEAHNGFDWLPIAFHGVVADEERSYNFYYRSIGQAYLYITDEEYYILGDPDVRWLPGQ